MEKSSSYLSAKRSETKSDIKIEKKSSMKKPRSRTRVVPLISRMRFRVGFDQENVNKTLKIPTSERTYGFIVAKKTQTPFPLKKSSLDADVLRSRLIEEELRQNVDASASYTSLLNAEKWNIKEVSSVSSDSLKDIDTFEVRRKKFYEGEFTIAKGKKLSDISHPELPPHIIRNIMLSEDRPKGSKGGDSLFSSRFNELQSVCQRLNIKLAKGFEY